MTTIGDLWRDFAVETSRIVKNRSKLQNPYSDVADLLMVIAEKEKLVFQELRTIKRLK